MKLTTGAVECLSRGAAYDDPDVNAVGPNGDLLASKNKFQTMQPTINCESCFPRTSLCGPDAEGTLQLFP